MKLLLIGPLPPPLGGTRISFNYLVEENKDFFNSLDKYDFINLSVISNSKFKNLILQLKILFKILNKAKSYDLVSLHANSKRVIIYSMILKLFFPGDTKFVFRIFGGDFDYYVSKKIYLVIIKLFFKNSTVLIQTKRLKYILDSEKIKNCNVEWFPTSRPIKSYQNFKKSKKEKFQLLYVGHIKEEKGVGLLIEACSKLFNENFEFDLNLIGRSIPENYLESSYDYKFLKHFGEISNEEVSDFIMECDLVIYPSFWKGEGYPGVLIESMNLGKPIIATDFKFLNELVNSNGILIKPRSLNAIYKSLKMIFENPHIYRKISDEAKKQKNKFDSFQWNGVFYQKTLKEEYVRNYR